MKKIKIKNMMAIIAIFTSATVIAMPSQVLNNDEAYSANETVMIRSIYCINPASQAGTNESSATLKMTTKNEYYKTVPWLLDNYGNFKVPSSLICELYYGPTASPHVGIMGEINRVNVMAASGDAYLYEGTFRGAFTNNFPIKTGDIHSPTDIDTNVLATVSAYTDESNINLVIESVITNTSGAKIPNTNYRFIKQTMTIPLPTDLNFYSMTNDGPSGIKFVTSIPTNTTIKSYTYGQKKTYYSKDEDFTIATLNPGTGAYAVTNNVNYLVPYGFRLKSQTVSPFTKIGFTYE